MYTGAKGYSSLQRAMFRYDIEHKKWYKRIMKYLDSLENNG